MISSTLAQEAIGSARDDGERLEYTLFMRAAVETAKQRRSTARSFFSSLSIILYGTPPLNSMVAHGRPLHLPKRDDPLGVPTTVAGIINTATSVDPGAAASATGLAYDGSATASTQSPPPLAITDSNIPVITITNSPANPTDSSTESSAPTELAAAASTKPISMSTVVGSCIGAFIGASALIVLAIWFYRRYSQSLKKRANMRGPLMHRNINGDQQRRRSRLEPWNKLEDDDDKWEDMYQTKETKEVDQVAPMEKLTMFKKTPSVRTAYTHKSTDVSAFDFPQSYAAFDPKLAETLSTGSSQMPEPRPFMGRVDGQTTHSWDSDTVASKSYLSVRSMPGGGAMSPTLHMAIPTPPPMFSQAHKWESAEVVHYSEAQSAETVDPLDDGDQRKSTHNPFFNARDDEPRIRSRSNSVAKSPSAKGKERMRYSMDPFDDINEQMPRPQFIHHTVSSSSSSVESKEKALQSLIAALDIPEEEVRDRLRIASMQPSVISQVSTVGGYDEDVTKEFPLPPSGGGSSTQRP
ncbi:hypothetical protein BDZ97DRAFT_1759135 [Flammula alnicola]|nr:hypothetical protein BDZ97DRAFT_1759135 [Flammula alnicola]